MKRASSQAYNDIILYEQTLQYSIKYMQAQMQAG